MFLPRRPEKFAARRCARWGVRLVCAGVSLGLAGAWAQGPVNGSIHGVVHDAAGRPLANAQVAAKDEETGVERTAKVLRDGTFLLAPLAAGEYAVRVEAASGVGGRVMVEVSPGASRELRATLAADASALEVKVASELAPAPVGVEPDENDDGLVSVNGLAEIQTQTAWDGVSATQSYAAVPVGAGTEQVVDADDDADSADLTTGPSHGLARGRHAGVAYTYAQGSAREFRLGNDGYSAQAGSAGAVLTHTTKSGGEQMHGSARFDLRSSALAAKDPLAIATSYNDGVVSGGEVKPHDLRENFAGTIGGPVRQGRPLRFFYAFDGQWRGFPAIASPADASFYELTAIQTDLLANRGVTAGQTATALNYLSSLTGPVARRADQNINFGRVDWPVRPRFAAGLEYNRARWNSPAGLMDSPVVARGRASLGNAAGSVDQVLLRVSPGLSGRTHSEGRVAFTRDLQYETPQAPLPQEAAIGPGGTSPEVNIGPNGLLFGTPATLSQVAYPDEQRIEAGDVVTLVRGHHLVEFGGTFARVEDRVATLGNAAGTFRYDSGATAGKAGGLVDFITDYTYNVNAYPNGGCPSVHAADHFFCFRSYSQSFGETTVAFATQQAAGFTEETWRPRPGARRGLMLHVGLRYEFTQMPAPQRPNAALDAVFGARGATSMFPADRNNFGPRASATFEPLGSGRLLVKAGYGVFYGHMPGATVQAALSDTGLAASTTRVRFGPTTIATSCPQTPTNGFGYLCSFTSLPPAVVASTTSVVVFDRKFRLPMVQQASLEVERQIGPRTSLAVGYVLNVDRQLPSSTDMNIAPSTKVGIFELQGGTGAVGVRDGETFVVPVYTSRVSTDWGPVTDVVSNANANYSGLVVKADSRVVRGLLVAGTYTWSKAIDFGQSESATPRTNGQFDPFADGYDKGDSSLNYPQALHASAVWTPSREGLRGVRGLANGWTVSGITVALSGRPYSYDVSGGTDLSGGHLSLNGAGGALYLPTVGRNTLRLPMTLKTDLRVGRGFRVWRAARGLAYVEGLNVFNHRSVSSVNQRAFLVGTPVGGVTPLVFQSATEIAVEGLNTTAFGTPTATGSSLNRARQVQFSVRLAF
jgi:hypothetical protein